jgi:hypothetical protein
MATAALYGLYPIERVAQFYFAKFQFRYNNRENADIFGTAIKEC